MKLVQFYGPQGALKVGLLQGNVVRDLTLPGDGLTTTNAYCRCALAAGTDLAALVAGVAAARELPCWELAQVRLTLPFYPDEVWGCGVTYKKSMEFRAEELAEPENIYERVYSAARPEVFFKGTAARCSGPGETIGKRADSHFTAPEPELAVLVGAEGQVLGYTLANDVSAWDIERENALYLPQSKIYAKCCALGPYLVTPDEIPDPYAIAISCRIRRQGDIIFTGASSTANLKRRIPHLVSTVRSANVLPPLTAILTGTGIIVPEAAALAPGDVVEITGSGLGTLENVVEEV
ncbi:MAG TPA: 2-keto-3-deoxy-D-arabinonate dehydratase [Firmicutes bacterium]|nr:2-keto-3-deoxy-D-arabinonate dehydratase [Bacillota bacterium]